MDAARNERVRQRVKMVNVLRRLVIRKMMAMAMVQREMWRMVR